MLEHNGATLDTTRTRAPWPLRPGNQKTARLCATAVGDCSAWARLSVGDKEMVPQDGEDGDRRLKQSESLSPNQCQVASRR